jgi:endonuclease YncB( thermonuclease family)
MIFAFAQVVAAGLTFTCTPIRVWDGDGPIWCAEGPKIRLAGIAAREIDGTCRPNQPCPTAGAVEARDRLAVLIGKPVGFSREGHVLLKAVPMRCTSVGDGKGSRTAAWCVTAQGVDLSCAMAQSGMALRWARYDGDKVCRR